LGAQNRAFVWPLPESPSALIAKNVQLADMLVSHVRTVSKGSAPFTLDWDSNQTIEMVGNEKEAVDHMKAMSHLVPKFGRYPLPAFDECGAKLQGLEQYIQSRQSAQYSRTDCNSLDGSFTVKLMFNEL
jgi:hypothetical protein